GTVMLFGAEAIKVVSKAASNSASPFIASLLFRKSRGRPCLRTAAGYLVDGADAAGLAGATLLPGTNVDTLASTVSWRHIREAVVVSAIVELHAITDTRVVLV